MITNVVLVYIKTNWNWVIQNWAPVQIPLGFKPKILCRQEQSYAAFRPYRPGLMCRRRLVSPPNPRVHSLDVCPSARFMWNLCLLSDKMSYRETPNSLLLWHIEAEPRWPPFSRRHFQMIFLNEIIWISIKISLKFVPRGPINIPALVQIMVWCRPGDKPLSEAMMVSLLTHICVTRPQGSNANERL